MLCMWHAKHLNDVQKSQCLLIPVIEIFAHHLNALHETCKAFIQTEADERIRWTLWNKVRASEQVFEHGDRD